MNTEGRSFIQILPRHLEELSIRYCPKCGRDDRHTPFGSKYHSTGGSRCNGEPIKLVYEFVRVAE